MKNDKAADSAANYENGGDFSKGKNVRDIVECIQYNFPPCVFSKYSLKSNKLKLSKQQQEIR